MQLFYNGDIFDLLLLLQTEIPHEMSIAFPEIMAKLKEFFTCSVYERQDPYERPPNDKTVWISSHSNNDLTKGTLLIQNPEFVPMTLSECG